MYLPHHDFPIAKPFVLPAITLKRGGRPRLEIPPAGHKRCETCRETKPFEAFARHNGSRDGHRNHCRECCITGRRKPIVETVEQRARRKERQSRPVWQTSHAAALKRWDERFPKAKAASIATHYAIARQGAEGNRLPGGRLQLRQAPGNSPFGLPATIGVCDGLRKASSRRPQHRFYQTQARDRSEAGRHPGEGLAMLDPIEKRRAADRIRKARQLRRQREGRVPIVIEIDEISAAEMFALAGDADKRALQEALQRFVDEAIEASFTV